MGLDLELLGRLTEACGPSGAEDEVAAILEEAFRDCGAAVSRDAAGNLLAALGGGRGAAVVAHMDEVGIVVRHVRPDGFLLVDRVGGIGRRSLAARPVRLLGSRGPVDGVLGVQSHHLTPPGEYETLPPVGRLYLDVGATSAAEVEALGIGVGTRGAFAGGLSLLGADLLCSKALDDRALCYALVAVARELRDDPPRGGVTFAATVREEFDLAGAEALARSLDQPLVIVLDVTPAVDTPDADGAGIALGRGPALKLQDFHGRGPLTGYIARPAVAELVREAARAAGVPLQEEVRTGVITDAGRLAPTLGLGRVACLSLPLRYTHSPVECARASDLEAVVRLTAELVRRGAAGGG